MRRVVRSAIALVALLAPALLASMVSSAGASGAVAVAYDGETGFTSTAGAHLFVHFSASRLSTDYTITPLVIAQDADGEVLFRILVAGKNDTLFFTNGSSNLVGRNINPANGGHTLLVTFDEGTYRVVLDDWSPQVLAMDAVGVPTRVRSEPGPTPVVFHSVRAVETSSLAWTSFAAPTPNGFAIEESAPGLVLIRHAQVFGHASAGYAEIRPPMGPGHARLTAPRPAPTYVVEASFDATTLTRGGGSALVVGGDAGGASTWGVGYVGAGRLLTYHGADGVPVPLASLPPRVPPTASGLEWHRVQAVVDEAAGTVALRLDGVPLARVLASRPGTSATLAFGYVGPDPAGPLLLDGLWVHEGAPYRELVRAP